MAKMGNEVRSIHWAVKLLLTVLVGGLFAFGALFIPIDALATVIPRHVVGPLCIVTVFIATIVFATFLYVRESNILRQSVLMGTVVGSVGLGIIMLVGYLVGYLLERWVSTLP